MQRALLFFACFGHSSTHADKGEPPNENTPDRLESSETAEHGDR